MNGNADRGPFVYILRNDQFPHLVKIGWTRRDPETRTSEIQGRGGARMPGNLEEVFRLNTPDAHIVEKAAHRQLSKWRRSGEWLEVKAEFAV